MQKKYCVENFPLDENQMQLLLKDANTLVIAGAGAGKTLTILGKINHLIETSKCLPKEILVVSFTNASVNDIKNRIKYDVNVYTFHKLAINILNSINYDYVLCSNYLLKYVITEYLKTCTIKEQKIILNFLNFDGSYKKMLNSNTFLSLCNLVETYINLFKANDYTYATIKKKNYTNLEKSFLIIIFSIYQIYIAEKLSNHELDFDDLIIFATKLFFKAPLKYKYIIIDEFQDCSLIRLNLIKEIFKYTNAKIICVGDDWQSIYRFSGCDLNIFLNFPKIFPNVNNVNLLNTYRNSQELISIASTFIQKNSNQIKKSLISYKRNETPIIFVPTTNRIYILKKLLNYLITISSDIMILSRNNNDILTYIDKDLQLNNNLIVYKNVKIKFFTVHKSKGLEAEQVIVLNCNDDYLGFPNKIENNMIINKLILNNEMRYAEERRLFYVAITRCKKNTYLIFDKNKPSIFIKEIKKIVKKQLYKITYFK